MMFSHRLDDGSLFVANERGAFEYPQYAGMKSADDLTAYVAKLWERAYNAKRPETERLIRMEKLYGGFHYEGPQANRNNVVANLAWVAVEDPLPAQIETRPRPEIIPSSRTWNQEKAARMQGFAEWLMDRGWWDTAWSQGVRGKNKHGYNIHLIVFDHETGMPYAKPFSTFNFYRDPAAVSEDTLQHFFLAFPVPTGQLRAMFPNARGIRPDGMASPEYEATVRPYYEGQRGNQSGIIGPLLSVTKESEPIATTTTRLVADTGYHRDFAETTFLVQLFIRDHSWMRVPYKGEMVLDDGTRVPGITRWFKERCSPSGWTVVQMTAGGVLLDCSPLDECYDGLPIVVGRAYDQRPYRFESPGEIDMQAPINRSINRRYNLTNKAAEFEGTPVLVYDQSSGMNFDNRSVTPGETVKKSRGSELRWLEYSGMTDGQFKMLDFEVRLWQMLTGNTDASQGRTPGGIEAAAAFREMRQASQKRIRGKEAGQLQEMATLLKKLMVCAARKLRRRIWYRASGDVTSYVDPDELLEQFDIRFAPGSGMAYTRAEQEEKSVALFQMGAIDGPALLEDLNYRRRGEVLQRLQAAQQLAALQQGAGGGGGPPGNGSKGAPSGAEAGG